MPAAPPRPLPRRAGLNARERSPGGNARRTPRTPKNVRMRVCVYACMRVCVHACMRACACAYAYVYVYVHEC
eukprot:11216869-Lingulodinium_polyedra.AAC.1